MIVGYHKSDKLRQVPTSEGKRYSEYYKCAFKEVRQDDPGGVEECIRDMLAEENSFVGTSLNLSSHGLDAATVVGYLTPPSPASCSAEVHAAL
jgi:hypothetical protein